MKIMSIYNENNQVHYDRELIAYKQINEIELAKIHLFIRHSKLTEATQIGKS